MPELTTSTPSVETVSIPLPGITVRRPANRGDGYRVEMGRFVGRGATLAAAETDLGRQIGIVFESVETKPGFAHDDGGALIVVLDKPWGLDMYRITNAGHRLISTSDRDGGYTPADEIAACRGFTEIPACR